MLGDNPDPDMIDEMRHLTTLPLLLYGSFQFFLAEIVLFMSTLEVKRKGVALYLQSFSLIGNIRKKTNLAFSVG